MRRFIPQLAALLIAGLAVCVSAESLFAQDAPAEPASKGVTDEAIDAALAKSAALDNAPSADDLRPRKAIVLSMQEAIRLTLENSMKVKINRIDPQTALAAVEKAEASFDWSFVGSWSGSNASTSASHTTSNEVDLALKKEFTTGTSIKPGVKWTRSKPTGSYETEA
jgi:hypothetical protein